MSNNTVCRHADYSVAYRIWGITVQYRVSSSQCEVHLSCATVTIQGVSKKVDKSETALYFVKRFNVRTFLLK